LPVTQTNKAAQVQAQTLFQNGLAELQKGNVDEADLLFLKSYELDQENVDVLNLLGIRQYQQTNYPEAIRLLSKANLLRGDSAQTLSNLGLAHNAIENFEKALEFFELAIAIDCKTPEIHNNRGNALKGLIRNTEALEAYKSALHLRPNYAEALSNQGIIFLEQQDYVQAIEYFERALQLNPKLATAFNSLGNAFTELGQFESAYQAFENALQINPCYLDACLNFGNCLKKAKQYDASIDCFMHAIKLKSTHAKTHYFLGEVFYEIGNIADAKKNYEKSLELDSQDIEVSFALTIAQIPKVYRDTEELYESRKQFAEHLNVISNSSCPSGDFKKILGCITRHPFYIAYQEENNQVLLNQFGDTCIKIAKPIQDSIDKKNVSQLNKNKKIQVGIVSHYFCNHPVWHAITKGWLTHLNYDLFDIHVFNTNGLEDGQTEQAKAKLASYTNGIHSTINLADMIREKNLAVLLFPEIGMDPTTKALACLRLATVQAVSWGHPETSGLSTIDYFLSAKDFEQSGSEDYYGEELIRLPKLGTYFESDDIQAQDINLSSLGISPDLPILLCAGSPSKYSPQNDTIFIEIAKHLGSCQFVFFNFQNELTSILGDRLHAVFKDANLNPNDFIRFIPFLKKPEFYGLMLKSDLYLDTSGFSGFNTAMQAIACNLPIVAKEGQYMRGRLASAILRNLGLDSLVSHTNHDYIDSVVKLIQNKELLKSYQEKIAQSKFSLFNNLDPIKALENFLIEKSEVDK